MRISRCVGNNACCLANQSVVEHGRVSSHVTTNMIGPKWPKHFMDNEGLKWVLSSWTRWNQSRDASNAYVISDTDLSTIVDVQDDHSYLAHTNFKRLNQNPN
jgi:hypothetical protein